MKYPLIIKYCDKNMSVLLNKKVKIRGPGSNNRKISVALSCERYTEHPANAILNMGSFSYSDGFNGNMDAHLLSIGRYCSIAFGAKIFPTNHPVDWVSTHPFQYGKKRFSDSEFFDLPDNFEHTGPFYDNKPKPINIGHNVWIGMNVTLAGGVKIGNGSIISANATVTKDVPGNSIVGGVPAKPIRTRIEPNIHEELEALEWWSYHYKDLIGCPFNEPTAAVSYLKRHLPNVEPMGDTSIDMRDILKNNFEE